jgi:hypothetical protein
VKCSEYQGWGGDGQWAVDSGSFVGWVLSLETGKCGLGNGNGVWWHGVLSCIAMHFLGSVLLSCTTSLTLPWMSSGCYWGGGSGIYHAISSCYEWIDVCTTMQSSFSVRSVLVSVLPTAYYLHQAWRGFLDGIGVTRNSSFVIRPVA